MMNHNQNINANGVNGRHSQAMDASPGRFPVADADTDQAGTGRQHDTGQNAGSANQRAKYSRQDNIKIMECYYISEPSKRGYMKRMGQLWRDRGGMNVTDQRLTDQARAIIKKGWLTNVELLQIEERMRQGEIGENSIRVEIEDEQTMAAISQSEVVNGSEEREQNNFETLTEEQKELVLKLRAMREELTEHRETLTPLRSVPKKRLMEELQKINKIIEHVPIRSISELNDTFYVSAALVTQKLERKRSVGQDPEWRIRLSKKVEKLRQDLSRLEQAKQRDFDDKYRMEVEKAHNIRKKGYNLVIEETKQRLQATAAKIRRYDDRIKQYQHNRLFESNQKRFYEEIQGDTKQSETPDSEEAKDFWKGIWGQATIHNKRAPWLEKVRNNLARDEQQENLRINMTNLQATLKKMPNWKAPGPDGVQGFWIKNLTGLHRKLAEHLDECLDKGETPNWMTTGRTVLIQKDRSKGTVAGNYRPITCLPIIWKLLTSMISDDIYQYLESNDLIGEEQKGCRRGYRGTKDHLMLDKIILKHCKARKTNLAMAWIDYQKAYDMVPHTWILETLQMVGASEKIRGFLKQSMEKWTTNLESNGASLGSVDIKRGIFQGDSLSPLLFVVCLIPMSVLLRDAKQGYSMNKNSEDKINHLLYMDDLKLYGKTKEELESLVETVRIFTDDVRMRFGLQKCATLTMKRGKKVEDVGIILPDNEMMKDLADEDYKYLGVLEACDIKMDKMKATLTKEYKRRLTLLLKSRLNSGNMVRAINTWAVAVLRYPAGILRWTKEEMRNMDRKTRKMMTMNGMLHPRANVSRLYLPRDEGGRGLISIEQTIETEEHGLSDYVKKTEKGYNRLLKAMEKEKSRKEYSENIMEERTKDWKEKPLHGQYPRLVADADNKKTYLWIKNGYMKKETEGMLTAAQDQALPTRWRKKHIEKQIETSLCRLCGEREETTFHILSECGKIAPTEYKKRHDGVAKIVHWNLSRQCGFKTSKKWYDHQTETVIENEKAKILWDMSIQTDHVIQARRPDIIMKDKELDHTWLIDIAVPGDGRVKDKEKEKVEKYQDLARELRKIWKTSVTVVPIVVGALGAVQNLEEELIKLNVDKREIPKVQFAALLGSARILRKVLDLPG